MNEYIFNIAEKKYKKLIIDKLGEVSIFSSIKDEYNALRCGVALRDISSNVLLKLFGNNVLGFLDRLTTNKIDSIVTNTNAVALFTNEKGNIIERTHLLNMDNMVMISGCFGLRKKISKWIDRYIALEDIIFEDVTEKYFQLEIIGPQKEAFMSLICDDSFKKISENNIVHLTINNYNFFVTHIKDFGIDKYYIFGNNEFLQPIADYLFEEEKLFDLKLIGNAAFDVYRVEQGLPSYPNEINDKYNPFEIGLSDEVDIGMKNFIGREFLKDKNIADIIGKKLSAFTFKNGTTQNHLTGNSNGNLELINGADKVVGNVSSLVKSELLKKYLTLAFVYTDALNSDEDLFAYNGKDKFKLNQIELPLRK